MEGEFNQKHQGRLDYRQVERLNEEYQLIHKVHGRGSFPTLEISLQNLVKHVHAKLTSAGIPVKDVRLNGGFACYILADSACNQLGYNDIDVIFSVKLNDEDSLLKIKDLVIECLLEYYLPEVKNRDRLSVQALKEAYVNKLTKVWNPVGDKWSLIGLSNNGGQRLELKFVDTMKRKFQFSVDSFQIIVDSLIQFYDISSEQMSEDFYPSVIVESMYGDFAKALSHLNRKLIVTYSPNEIRGGGLLKYCDLLSRGYVPDCNIAELEKMEQLMCSRFFIDYTDVVTQGKKLLSYLDDHFQGNYGAMLAHLHMFHSVVNQGTVCLMGHERRLILNFISQTAIDIQNCIRCYAVQCGEPGEEAPLSYYCTFTPIIYGELYSGVQGVY